jgi:hypothetical protein
VHIPEIELTVKVLDAQHIIVNTLLDLPLAEVFTIPAVLMV